MYRPLPSYLTIKSSEIEGLGLFTTDDIDNKHVLGITHVYDVRFQDSFIRTPLGGFFNHSETPNCEVIRDGEYLKLKAIRDIKAGEEITARYTLYDPTKL
jgi:SET domain-containing protein